MITLAVLNIFITYFYVKSTYTIAENLLQGFGVQYLINPLILLHISKHSTLPCQRILVLLFTTEIWKNDDYLKNNFKIFI